MALTFGCEISYLGDWVDLNDHLNFQITGDTREETTTQWRRITAASVVVEGTYTVHATRENVTEKVGVWVYGGSQAEVSTNLSSLVSMFSQSSYQIRWTFGNSQETWDCFAADYSLVRNQAFAHNTRALFSAQVPYLPNVTFGEI